jgi:hypothetical protein
MSASDVLVSASGYLMAGGNAALTYRCFQPWPVFIRTLTTLL